MYKHIAVVSRMLAFAAVMTVGSLGCATDGEESVADEPLTGTWDGSFTSDNQLVSMGTFTFMVTENASGAISGNFTGAAAGQNLAGTLSGMRTGNSLAATISVTTPIALMLSFPGATIDGDRITGTFMITSPVTANGDFMVMRK